MSADNVTPFRAGPKAAAGKRGAEKQRRTRWKAVKAVVLEEFPEEDRIRIYDVLAGLHGVCESLDGDFDQNDMNDLDRQTRLSMAAHVLSTILHHREGASMSRYRVLKEVEVPQEEGSHAQD